MPPAARVSLLTQSNSRRSLSTNTREDAQQPELWNGRCLPHLISGFLCFSTYKPNVYHKSAFLTVCHSSTTSGSHVSVVIWAIDLKISCEPREHFPQFLKLWQNKYGYNLAHICSAMPHLGHMCQIILTCGPNVIAIWVICLSITIVAGFLLLVC